MGKKRGRNGKYLLFHCSCLLAVLSLNAGCVTISVFQKKWQGHKHLELAENLISKGDYEGALKAYDEVVRIFPDDSPGDSALFHMGLIWAHPENPQRNYKKALGCFRRFLRDFPRSALREEVRVWVSIINELIRCEGKIKDLEEEVSTVKTRLNGSKKEVNALKTRLNGLKEELNTLQTRLNALKEIDIGIEEKRREDLPRK
jgi:tetratricopeptide (TPR) repeat protein